MPHTGHVTAKPEAVLPLTIYDARGGPLIVEVVMDTGFSDFLTLTPATITKLGLPFVGAVEVTLADGSTVMLAMYSVVIWWHSSKRTVDVIAADGKPLLGMSLLYGSRVEMDIVDGGAFTVSPIA